MELVKKILLSILVVIGIAFAGVIICLGVMVVAPSVRIFGYSYLNTSAEKVKTAVSTDIANIETIKNDTYNFVIETTDFDVEIASSNTVNNKIVFDMTNNVIGFTNSMDSNKFAKVNVNYDESSKTMTVKVTEPTGWFLKANRVLRIQIPQNLYENNTVNLKTLSNNGTMTFGETGSQKLRINDIESSCTGLKGSVNFKNAGVNGTLKIKNIFGRILVNDNLSGNVIVDSTIGTYIFKSVGNLEVVASTEEGKINNPSITVDDCNNLTYNAESGYLKVNGKVYGDLEVHTDSANIDVNTTVNDVFVENNNGKTSISQVGSLSTDASKSSWNMEDDGSAEALAIMEKPVVINSKDGDIYVGSSLFRLGLTSTKGKITVNNAYRKVQATSEYGAINISFKDASSLPVDSFDQESNTVNAYISSKLLNLLDTTQSMLDVKNTYGYIAVSNIRSAIDINATESQIELKYLQVKGASNISTSSKQVSLKTPLDNFILITKQNKNSNAKYLVKYASIQLNNYPTYEQSTDSNGKISRYTEDNYQCARFLVNSASEGMTNVITIINTTGAIIAEKI